MENLTKEGELRVLQNQLMTSGAGKLSDTELLGIVLNSPGHARSIVCSCSDWKHVNRAELEIALKFRQMKVAQVLALVELSERVKAKPLKNGEPIRCSADVSAVYLPRLSNKKQETFVVLGLDNRNRVIAEHLVAKGTLSQVEVHPREAYRELIKDGAAHAIAVHNHPSGDPTPSHHDIAISRRLHEVGEIIGIELLDFIIVASEGSTSFRDLGLMGGAA